MEEHDPFVDDQQQVANNTNYDELNQETEVLSQINCSDDIIEHTEEYVPACSSDCSDKITNNVCQKCTELNLELQKNKLVVLKLQKRCAQKSAEIKRLRAAEKRAKCAKMSLEEILREIKENKWISDEGQEVLKVNN